MHRTLGDGYVVDSGRRVYADEAPPTRSATQVRHQEMNALQEEIAAVIESTGATLNDGAEPLTAMNQLNTAIDYKITDERIAREGYDGYLEGLINSRTTNDIGNSSSVPGSTTTAALNNLLSAITNKVMRGYIDGFNISVATDPTAFGNWMDFGGGFCMDRLNQMPIARTGTMRKIITTAWASGHANGGWAGSTGSPRTNFYHYCFVIYRNSDGNVDFGFDDNPAAVNLLAASGYNRYRRVGACFLRADNLIRGFRQEGDWFYHYQSPISETLNMATGSGGYLAGTQIIFPNPDYAFGNRSEVGHDIRKVAFGLSAPANSGGGGGVFVNIWPQTMSSRFTPSPNASYNDACFDSASHTRQQTFIVKPYPEEENVGGRAMLLSNITPSSACDITYWCFGYEDTRGRFRS